MPSSACPAGLLSGGALALVGSWGWGAPRTYPQRRPLSPFSFPTWAVRPQGGGAAWGQQSPDTRLDLGSVTQISPHWAGTFWGAPCGAMGEGTRKGSCPSTLGSPRPPATPPGPSEVGSALLPRRVGQGAWGLKPRQGSGPSRGCGPSWGTGRVPAGRRRGALRLQPSPRGARRRLFRASWPPLRACRAYAGGRRRPIARAHARPPTPHRRPEPAHLPPATACAAPAT